MKDCPLLASHGQPSVWPSGGLFWRACACVVSRGCGLCTDCAELGSSLDYGDDKAAEAAQRQRSIRPTRILNGSGKPPCQTAPTTRWRSEMKLKLALAGLIASTLAFPALAQMSPGASQSSPSNTGSAAAWYVVQDTSTETCEVTSLKPTTRGKTKAVGKNSYISRTEAESDLSKIPECSK